jgi:hypothetical protein
MNESIVQEQASEVPFLMNFQETNPQIVDTEGAYDAAMQCWLPVLAVGADTGTMTYDIRGSSDSDFD